MKNLRNKITVGLAGLLMLASPTQARATDCNPDINCSVQRLAELVKSDPRTIPPKDNKGSQDYSIQFKYNGKYVQITYTDMVSEGFDKNDILTIYFRETNENFRDKGLDGLIGRFGNGNYPEENTASFDNYGEYIFIRDATRIDGSQNVLRQRIVAEKRYGQLVADLTRFLESKSPNTPKQK